MMAHVFISYAHVDADFVALLKLELEKDGLSIWVDSDRLRAGEDWRQGIDEAIQAAFALIAVMTPESYQSQYVTYEWAYALGIGVKVIPLMLRTTTLHPRLEAIQYLNFTVTGARPWEKLTAHLHDVEANQLTSQVRVGRDAPAAVKQAVLKLDSSITEERRSALESLAQMSHPAALQALADAVQHPTRDVQIQSAFMLADSSQYKDLRATPGLMIALKDTDSNSANRAAKALRRLHDPRAIPALLDALHREDGRLRRTAASALSQFGSQVVPQLIAELEHRDERVREVAAWALGEIQDESVVEALPALTRALASTRTLLVKAAEDAILKIGKPALPALSEAAGSTDWNVRLSVVKLLSEIGSSEACAVLVSALKDSSSVIRIVAAEALGVLGDENTVKPLIEALHDPDSYDVRCAAAMSLGVIGNTSAIPALIAILEPDQQQSETSTGRKVLQSAAWPDVHNINERQLRNVVADSLKGFETPEALAAVEHWQRQLRGEDAE
ncbi:MAG: HEAT repeat domain-containing protein [Anaerolineae bacterium]